MTTRPADAMLDMAIDLLAGAVILQDVGNDHAALLLAIARPRSALAPLGRPSGRTESI
ncbi:MAG: hypothetical protein ACNYZH_06035 [Acidimicrobiia bacterium]